YAGRMQRHASAIALVFALMACSHVERSTDDVSSPCSVWVLGTAQDGGVPHVGCQKACCADARREGFARYPACLGVVDREHGKTLLIEATPSIDAQITLLQEATGLRGTGRNPVDAVLLTHAHIGHYAGLVHFGREVASTKKLPVWVSERMAAFLRTHGPWQQLVELEQIELHTIRPGDEFRPLPAIRVRAIAVPHRDEYSDTMAFQISGPNRTVLFVPDIDRWDDDHDERRLDRLLDGVDVAYLDGTFWDGSELPGRNLAEIPHPLITATMLRLSDRARHMPGSLRFLHLNHTNPLWREPALQRRLEEAGFGLARRGERVDL
ncbi:MAG: MBL fold metallo-hydrolase, partial [Planctomycetes bacterium]|nr:MBL fold metallo-hydrolase [Planctomycetota bacterium]